MYDKIISYDFIFHKTKCKMQRHFLKNILPTC